MLKGLQKLPTKLREGRLIVLKRSIYGLKLCEVGVMLQTFRTRRKVRGSHSMVFISSTSGLASKIFKSKAICLPLVKFDGHNLFLT